MRLILVKEVEVEEEYRNNLDSRLELERSLMAMGELRAKKKQSRRAWPEGCKLGMSLVQSRARFKIRPRDEGDRDFADQPRTEGDREMSKLQEPIAQAGNIVSSVRPESATGKSIRKLEVSYAQEWSSGGRKVLGSRKREARWTRNL